MNAYTPITEVAPQQVASCVGKPKCDECNKTFEAKETLMQINNSISFGGILGVKSIQKGKNTYYLVSPCCKKVHLQGFDMI